MSLLIDILWRPHLLEGLTTEQWDILLRQARTEKLLAHVGHLIDQQALAATSPTMALDIIADDRVYLEHQHTQVRLEVRELHRSLSAHGITMVLLKGAAYIEADLPFSQARHLSDVDILVPESRLEEAEQVLTKAGWASKTLEEYDEHYYRTWMHELPPMSHGHRAMEVDIHHRILPRTSRLQPNPQPLLQDSLAAADEFLRIPCPADMFLHSATHLFYDSDFHNKLRDLLDLHQLAMHFKIQPDFWDELVSRAEQLQLTLPLYYALACCNSMLHTPIPNETMRSLRRSVGPGPIKWLTRRIACRVLTPNHPDRRPPILVPWLLYLRSHWLRMPPGLLTRHLFKKTIWRILN